MHIRVLFHGKSVNTQNGLVDWAGLCCHSTNDLDALAFEYEIYLRHNSSLTTEMFPKQD